VRDFNKRFRTDIEVIIGSHSKGFVRNEAIDAAGWRRILVREVCATIASENGESFELMFA
jgi:hypothetical protein